MNRRIHCLPSLLFLLTLLFASASQADEALEGDQIKGFISSLSALQSLGEKYSSEDWAQNQEFTMDETSGEMNPMAESVAAMRGHDAYDEVADVVEEHGFDSPEQWGSIGDRIIKAYTAATLEVDNPGARGEMEQALRELENSPHMTAEQKAMLKKSMGGAMAAIRSMTNAPQADIEAVQPYLADIERAFTANAAAASAQQ